MSREKMKVNLYPEICCELCNEIIHNHFDCPVCKKGNEPTNIYGSLDSETEIACDKCRSRFKIISKNAVSWMLELELEEVKHERK